MKKLILFAALLLGIPGLSFAQAVPGQAAPNFEAKDFNGKTHKLADFRGKWVVLEWFNQECPYVKKHYGSSNMQKLQKTYTAKGVTWLSVLSSAPGKQGHLDPAAAKKSFADHQSAATALLLDPSGTVGRAYGAKTTPHLFVIDPQGKVVYAGAIDDNDSADPATIATSKNYLAAALDAGLAGKTVEVAQTKPYGCGVKYGEETSAPAK